MFSLVANGTVSVPVDYPNLAPVLLTDTVIIFILSLTIVLAGAPGDDKTFGKLIPSAVLLILATLFSTGVVSAKQQASYEAEVRSWLDSNAGTMCVNSIQEAFNGYALSYDPAARNLQSSVTDVSFVKVDLTQLIETDKSYLVQRDDGVYVDCYGSGALEDYLDAN